MNKCHLEFTSNIKLNVSVALLMKDVYVILSYGVVSAGTGKLIIKVIFLFQLH